MIVLIIDFPQKNLSLKLQIEDGDITLAELTEVLGDRFGTLFGIDWACYFKLPTSDEYLDNSKTIDELNLKTSEYKLLAYIDKKDVAETANSSIIKLYFNLFFNNIH
jgi:hypothetical protein